MERKRNHHDVVVVGSRCAGAATAMLLARAGHDVALVDRATFPSDTLSTHAIARGGMVQLARWGLLDEIVRSGAPEVRTVTFHLGDGEVLAKDVKARAGIEFLLAPRRYVLDTILVHAALEAGATLYDGVTVAGVRRGSTGRVHGVAGHRSDGSPVALDGTVVVGADGLRSRVARSVGAPIIDQRPADGSTHYVYAAGLDGEGFEFHIGERSFAGVFPTHGGESNVWVCLPAEDARFEGDRTSAFLDLLDRTSPSLGRRLRRSQVTARVRSAVRFPNHIRQATGCGWALVGDAGYHRDPITGHGITDALRDAELLSREIDALLRGDCDENAAMERYAHARLRAIESIFDVTCRLAEYPDRSTFVDLQKQLSALIEAEAQWLAALPLPSGSAASGSVRLVAA